MRKSKPKKTVTPAEDDIVPTTEELVAEDHFLLHTLVDLLIETELITKEALQDKFDNIESEFFVDECEEKEQQPTTKKKKK